MPAFTVGEKINYKGRPFTVAEITAKHGHLRITDDRWPGMGYLTGANNPNIIRHESPSPMIAG